MKNSKIQFLKNQFPIFLATLSSNTKGKWGVLNAQQMVEHFSESIRMANGKFNGPQVVPEENLLKLRNFMLSDKPFKENTTNPLMNEKGAPLKWSTMNEAITELKQELSDFFTVFERNSTLTTANPFFGPLNFEENVHLLYKHALHHLKQFDIIPE